MLWGCHCPERLMSPWQWKFFSREVGAYTTMLALWIGPSACGYFPLPSLPYGATARDAFPDTCVILNLQPLEL